MANTKSAKKAIRVSERKSVINLRNKRAYKEARKDVKKAIELKDHPWFLGVQFHPELKSRPFEPHKIFISFIEAAIKNKNLNL